MVRLLAYGDSLVAGYCGDGDKGPRYAPWAPLLRTLLSAACVDHVGASGLTLAQMVARVDSACVQDCHGRTWPGLRHLLRSARPGYHAVLILAGANDLGERVGARNLVESLAALHDVAHALGVRTVALTIPQSRGAAQVSWLRDEANAANAAIREWVAAQPAGRVGLVDAAPIVPWPDGGAGGGGGLWAADGLHMSAAGYAAFARGVAPDVAEFVVRTAPWHQRCLGAAVARCMPWREGESSAAAGALSACRSGMRR